jgi:S1/P1 Nuclease
MRASFCAILLAAVSTQHAWAWGQEGHSIIAEIAQREVAPATRQAIDQILRHGSLASVASWADDIKYTTRPDTAPWHFVDIPLAQQNYRANDCIDKKHPGNGDTCLVAALEKLEQDLSCAGDDGAKLDALRFIVHLVGDSTQPLHTVDDLEGGNKLSVKVEFCGLKDAQCHPPAQPPSVAFHVLWDTTLITETFYDWGGYVDRLYDHQNGWLNSAEARGPDPAGDSVVDWINDTHARARHIWTDLLPASDVIDQSYYTAVLPVIDRQLGIGGLRLARYLDAAMAPGACQAR